MKCSKAKLCGGCPLLSQNYEKQMEIKRDKVAEMVQNAHLHLKVGQVHAAKEPRFYRNKVIVGFAKDRNKHVYSGLYAPRSHKVINTSGCIMQPKIVNEIIDTITQLVESMKIQIYNPQNGTGLLRHVLIRYSQNTNEVMVVFVTAKREFPSRKNLVNALREKYPQIVTILQNINPRDTSIVMQDETMVLYGKGVITDILAGMKISFSASAFYQINHDQCEVLYNLGKEMLDLKPDDKILDTYCGVGTIGLYYARFCKSVTGVEINRDAVSNAIYNAKQNGIDNIRFVAMDSTRYMQEAKRSRQHYNAIILDPPRAGTTPSFIENACALKPDKILYISCDPSTQIRDLKIFRQNGYVGDKMELVDMFPNTEHLESLVLLKPDIRKSTLKNRKFYEKGKQGSAAPRSKSFANRKTPAKNRPYKSKYR